MVSYIIFTETPADELEILIAGHCEATGWNMSFPYRIKTDDGSAHIGYQQAMQTPKNTGYDNYDPLSNIIMDIYGPDGETHARKFPLHTKEAFREVWNQLARPVGYQIMACQMPPLIKLDDL